MSTGSAPRYLVALLTLCALSHLACGMQRERREAVAQSDGLTMMHEGMERSYRLLVPDDLPERPALLVGLHGGGGNGKQLMNHAKLGEMAMAHGFVGLFPDGIDSRWNDGRGVEGNDAPDSAFLAALITQVVEEHGIDPQRVYITGISNGGFMSARMLCDHAEMFAGAAMVAAGLVPTVAEQCTYSVPSLIMIFKGKDDPLVPYGGGTLANDRGEMMSTEAELSFWRKRNQCADKITESYQYDKDPDDDILLQHDVYGEGCAEHPVEIYTATGGGHTWPGNMSQYAPKFVIGEPYDDVDATRELLVRFGLWR